MTKRKFWKGKINICKTELDLDLTLLGGQSFRWIKGGSSSFPQYKGTAFDAYWLLNQNKTSVTFKVYPIADADKSQRFSTSYFTKLLHDYFRIDFDLKGAIEQWKSSHMHFNETVKTVNAVRVLSQEPFENILSFICSQNNHIRRISHMIEWFCSKYGREIVTFKSNERHYAFPTLEALAENKQLEMELREAKFGYRAKFIAGTVAYISESGGLSWLLKLRNLTYEDARNELLKLPGIGFKVADCICLMSLNHLESIPIDTHIYQIVQRFYMPELATLKSVHPKIYLDIAKHLRSIYGENAGWAQAILFCSELPRYQPSRTIDEPLEKRKKVDIK